MSVLRGFRAAFCAIDITREELLDRGFPVKI
jgi:hypothetical protein